MREKLFIAITILAVISSCKKDNNSSTPNDPTTASLGNGGFPVVSSTGLLGSNETFDNGMRHFATNDGIYIYKYVPSAVGKCLLTKYMAGTNLKDSVVFDPGIKGPFFAYYPNNSYEENRRDISITWCDTKSSLTTPRQFYHVQSGGATFDYELPLNHYQFEAVIPNNHVGNLWVINNQSYVDAIKCREPDHVTFTTGLPLSAPHLTNIPRWLPNITVNKAKSSLYISWADKILEYGHDVLLNTYDLSPFGIGPINQVTEMEGILWIGYGKNILKLENGNLTKFLEFEQKESGEQTVPKNSFCTDGKYIYTYEGKEYYITSAGPGVSFIGDKSKMDTQYLAQYNSLKASLLGGGLYCSVYNKNAYIYQVVGKKLIEIHL